MTHTYDEAVNIWARRWLKARYPDGYTMCRAGGIGLATFPIDDLVPLDAELSLIGWDFEEGAHGAPSSGGLYLVGDVRAIPGFYTTPIYECVVDYSDLSALPSVIAEILAVSMEDPTTEPIPAIDPTKELPVHEHP